MEARSGEVEKKFERALQGCETFLSAEHTLIWIYLFWLRQAMPDGKDIRTCTAGRGESLRKRV